MGLDWGSVPVWVGILLTSVSVVVAVRTYVLNSRRALQEQASQVMVTVQQAQGAPDILHTAVVTNHSKAPIWRVVLEVNRYMTMESSERKLVVAPDESFAFTTEVFWQEKFVPGTVNRLAESPLYGVVRFVDAQGYQWRRSSTGVLSPQPRGEFRRAGPWRSRFRAGAYRFRRIFIPTRLRHGVRDRWRAYNMAKPSRYSGSEKDV